MQKCSLCGGRIVNGRCQDCGMPYPEKPRYTLRSETAHTHTVNGEEVLHRVRKAAGKAEVYSCDAVDEQDHIDLEGPRSHSGHRPTVHGDKRRGGWLITLIVLGLALLLAFELARPAAYHLPDLVSTASSTAPEAVAEDTTGENPYEGLDWGLPAVGEDYECDLTAGFYTVGQQIPEGVYTVTAAEGADLTMLHQDKANAWYQTTLFIRSEGEDPDDTNRLTNVQLAAGGTLWLDGCGTLQFVSNNAQVDAMAVPAANPLTESAAMIADRDNSAELQVGADIAPGTYDVTLLQGTGVLGVEGVSDYNSIYFSDGDGTLTFHGLVLQPDTELTLDCYSQDPCQIRFTPSDEVYE